MSQIETTAVFPNIAPGNVEEFKQIAARVLEKTIPEPAAIRGSSDECNVAHCGMVRRSRRCRHRTGSDRASLTAMRSASPVIGWQVTGRT